MSDFSDKTILVTGASGHLGRLVVEELLARGAKHVIGATRDPAKLDGLKAKGVEVRRLDFNDAATLDTAFAGVERALLISTDAVGARIGQHSAAIAAAEKAGVKSLAYTSLPSPLPDPESPVSYDHFWTEVALFKSGLDWSILRNNIYAEIAVFSAAPALKSGQWFDAAGDGGRAYVSREDAARAAAGALLTAEGKQIFDISGPEALTQAQLAALVAEIGGKPIQRIALDGPALAKGLEAAGVGAQMATVLAAFDIDASLGRQAIVTGDVEKLSGRKPRTMRAVLEANKAALG